MNLIRWMRNRLNQQTRTPFDDKQPSQVMSDWNEEMLRSFFDKSGDVQIVEHRYANESCPKLVLIYCTGMIDSRQFMEWALPILDHHMNRSDDWQENIAELTATLQMQSVRTDTCLYSCLFSGQLIVFFESLSLMYSVNIPQIPQRTPEESTTEISVKGPRDAFTEELSTNIALIRKRLRTPSLCNEMFEIGKRSRTRVSLLYINDIANPDTIQEARKRLNGIHIDALLSSAELEEGISDSSFSMFPLIDYIGRPDFVAESLIRGRFAILVDGSPMALIAPSNLTEQIKSPEDLHFTFYFVGFERMIRLVGLFVAIFTPGFWVALSTYNMEQLPFPLLATVATSRIGLPTSAPLEAVLMLFLFEIFREAGVRLPKAVGQTIAVVGGLIIGDAAIRAGLASPTMLIMSSVTAVATFTLVNQSLSGTVSILRLIILLCSSVLGLYGYFLSMFFTVVYLSGLRSFGVPYLAPLSPPGSLKEIVAAVASRPRSEDTRRPSILDTTDTTREGKDS
ncbi:spore germination protein [Paenibacillus sp. NPDC056579]|uniref:spore germination protein n=1 Tax=unclassified Paenibacillus TaxID=185978 RepID=UPI001EF978E4|nr:spore germination protein [Paenibacillus sp. H1-7]ULL13731.1 spore germination protein [Paenibacillus sp. H1-7]